MSNHFNLYTPENVGAVAVGLVNARLKLATVVGHYGPNDFKEGRGDTVFLNVPGALTAHSRTLDDTTNAIVIDSLTESQEPIQLDTHAYSAIGLSERDLALNLMDFSSQVLMPQTDAVADKIENAIERVLAGVAPTVMPSAYSSSAPVKTFTAGRAALRARGIDVADANLVAIVGSAVADNLLDSGDLDYAKTGAADALRSGSLGRIRGFETIESGRIGEDEIIFMTRAGIYLAHRAPAVSPGVAYGAISQADGMSLRYIRDYDSTYTKDRSVVSTFVGFGILPLYRVERTQDAGTQGDSSYTAGSATITPVPGGAVVKFDTAA